MFGFIFVSVGFRSVLPASGRNSNAIYGDLANRVPREEKA